jgi:hypothetical protein
VKQLKPKPALADQSVGYGFANEALIESGGGTGPTKPRQPT